MGSFNWRFACFLLLTFSLVISGFDKNPRVSEKAPEKIYKLIINGRLEEAKSLIDKYRNSESREIKELLLLYYLRKGFFDEASSLLVSLSKVLPFERIIHLPEGKYGIICDKRNERIYIVEGREGSVKLVSSFPCITGKKEGDKLEEGDQRTPEGVYFAVRWIDGKKLPPIYGDGAFELNYPNLIDRVFRKDGHGIWLHGTNDPNRPPHSSNGCIVVSNNVLSILKDFISLKETPIVIVNGINGSVGSLAGEKVSILSFIESWRRSWENSVSDLDGYFSHYSKRFSWKGGDLGSWMRYKRRITRAKKFIKVSLKDIKIIKDYRSFPFGFIYVVTFKQSYLSNNFSSKDMKVLYLIREEGSWKILGEEAL